jgi:hypothetical protein
VPITGEILVVGFSCIVVGVKMTEVLQLREDAAFVSLNTVSEPCRDTASTLASGAAH